MTLFKKKSELNFLENDVNNNKVKNWFSKWDRTIAAITGVVIFCAVLILVIVRVKVRDDDGPNPPKPSFQEFDSILSNIDVLDYDKSSMAASCSLLREQVTAVVCTGVTAEDLCDQINSCVDNEIASSVKRLQLIDIGYTNGKIEVGWLNCVNFSLAELDIQSSSKLKDIDKNAFNVSALTNLEVLNLNTSISNFRRDMFEGLFLQRLTITCQSYADFEYNVFGAISKSLNNLQLTNCLSQTRNDVLPKITGASEELIALKQLDVRSNNIRKITANSFASAVGLTTLYVSLSSVTEIEAGAFDGLFLITLDLSSNQLKTLPEGLFRDTKKGIILLNNNFNCDCNLLWLKNMVDRQPKLFNPALFNCLVDQEVLSYTSVTFCSNTTTTTTTEKLPTTSTESSTLTTKSSSTSESLTSTSEISTSTSESSTLSKSTSIVSTTTTALTPITTTSETTSTPPIDVRKIKCLKDRDVSINFFDSSESITVIESKVTISFKTSNNATYILIQGSAGYNLLWFKAEDKSDTNCLLNITINSLIEIPSLEPDVFYIFCLMTPNETIQTPYDCASFKMPKKETPCLTWLSNDEMIPFICGICASLILVALITGLTVFYCIRQHPSLIKGNKRVIIVESEAADAIVMPTTYYNDSNYRPPSLNSHSNGYLTPRCHIVYSPRPRSHLRTISERTEFVVPTTNTGGRYRKGHYRQRIKLEQPPKSYDEHVYEPPPPLPPNHPSRVIYSDSVGRSYSRA